MNVKELKEAIADLPDDMEVILQKDGEGNGYSPLADIDSEAIYIPESTWSGEVVSTTCTPLDAGEDEWEEFKKNNPRCLVLMPVN